jgi:aspartate/methionine/tyrosine aminotransferase
MKPQAFKLERFFAKYEFQARYILCASDCEAQTIGELLTLEPDATANFQRQWLGYTESQGDPELRELISQLYSTTSAANILVHSGAEEAIFSFMNVALQPGDHIIVHFPCYQSLFEVAAAIGCEVTRWETHEADNWELDLDFLQKALKTNTKAIVINCPHNPTGYVMSRAKLDSIIEIAHERQLLLFSDEVYRLLERNPADTLPPACDLYENAVSLGVMSKAFGLPGLRIGWIATKNAVIYQQMAAFKDYLTICNNAPSEFLAKIALRHTNRIVERNLQIINTNLALLDTFFGKYSDLFNWVAPKSGSTAFPSLRTGQPVEQFCLELVEQQGVLLLPSDYYDFGHKNFRLGYGRKNLAEALPHLEQFILGKIST